ncbi:MAG: aminopeptidase, partial [Chloroflexota bacterium]
MIDFNQNLEKYADVIVKVGLNIQPGQRLLIFSPSLYDGDSHASRAFIRSVAKSAYQIGDRLVDVIWNDDEITLSRYTHAPRDSFEEYPQWIGKAYLDIVQQGDGLLSITGNDPDLLKGQDADLIAAQQKARSKVFKEGGDYGEKHPYNWCVAALPTESWAAKVFPDSPANEQINDLWEAIFQICRIYEDDPITAWEAHIQDSRRRAEYMTNKNYQTLKYTGPGTNLTVGLAKGHQWIGSQSYTEKGFGYVANIPSEEIFTMPHREVADGVVTATKPLSRGGALMDDFSVTFENGRVTKVQAKKNEEVLRKMIETDEGAARLGEVALVPHSSPISQSGLLFYNTLFDENASNHIALGSAYRETMKNGESMSD